MFTFPARVESFHVHDEWVAVTARHVFVSVSARMVGVDRYQEAYYVTEAEVLFKRLVINTLHITQGIQ